MRKAFFGVVLMMFALQLSAQTSKTPLLRHVVLFKFKDNAPREGVKKTEDAFRALQSKIPQIKSYEWGTNVSPENKNEGYTHCFYLTFLSDKDRDAYLVHPVHKAFGGILSPYIDKVLVIDYWAKN